MRRPELILAWLLGSLEVLLGLALAAWLLTWPSLFRVYYPGLGISAHAREAQAVMDWLATSHRERTLQIDLNGQLSPKELRHYSDVRRVFRRLPYLAAGLFLAWIVALGAARPRWEVLRAAQGRGLALWLILVLFLAGLAAWDWKIFFAWVHEPLFGERSWRFSNRAYSLKLFPPLFWRLVGGMTLLGPVLLLAGTWSVARLGGGRRSKPGRVRAVGPGSTAIQQQTEISRAKTESEGRSPKSGAPG